MILVADDEQPARYGMTRALESLDCEIIEAEDGQQTLDLIRSRAPDLVFLDLNMPVLDGRQVLAELGRQPQEYAAAEIIVVTARDDVTTAVECVRAGAADYLVKPYEVDHLRSIATRSAERVRLQSRVDELQQQVDREQAHAFC